MTRLEEFGDYLLARGRINGWRIKEEGRYYTSHSLIGMVFGVGKPNNYIEVYLFAIDKVVGMGKEDLPQGSDRVLEPADQMVHRRET